CRFRWFDDPDVQVGELAVVDRGRGLEHEVSRGLRLRKRNDLADRWFASQQHHRTVDAWSDSAVRRSAVFKRLEQVTKPVLDLFRGIPHEHVDLALHVTLVDAD